MGRNSKSRKVITRSESGTCNVCSAPCSSCLHINRALTNVKSEESSGESCQENVGSQYSVTDIPVKTSACNSGPRTASETSNIVSSNSNCDINCRDVGSRVSLRSSDTSGASDDVGIIPTSSPGRTSELLCDKRALRDKSEVWKSLEGREDSTSCITGGSEANKLAIFTKRKGLWHGLDEFPAQKKQFVEKSNPEEKSEGVQSSNLLSISSCPSGGRFINPNVKDIKENLDSKKHLSLKREAASDLGRGQEAIDHRMHDEDHLLASEEICFKMDAETQRYAGNSVASEKVGPKLEAGIQTNTVADIQPNKLVNSSGQIEIIEKVEYCELPDMQESNVQSQHMNDTDESDVLEHDVKVCDICGDAGREDLLAICSRCSDGAEHTYCMRDMLNKVPEGDWLCEECKSCEESKTEDTNVLVSVRDKNQSSEVAPTEDTNVLLKLDGKDLDAEDTKTGKNILSKRVMDNRSADDIGTSSVAKKQALGPTVESLKSTTPSRAVSLSRDPSFRNLDKGEVKPSHQLPSAVCLTSDTSEDASSLGGQRQTARTLSKSSSFSTYGKPKVEFFDEIPNKKKVGQESTYIDKEGVSKLIGRSMSFRPLNSGRLNSSESKVKMLSPKFSHPQDHKGLKAKAMNVLDRKTSFKSERTSVMNADQKLVPTDPLISDDGELKGVPGISKSSTLSKPTSHTARKGEVKISTLSDQKSKETNNPGGRIRETSVSRSRTCVDSPRNLASEVSAAARSAADVIKGNKLKAAIEAAMLKKPGICRKNKTADQCDELPVSKTELNCEIRPEDHLSTSSERRNTVCGAREGQATSDNGDQYSPIPSGAASLKAGDNNCLIAPPRLSSQSSAAVSVLLKMPVLPEHEYIWQGAFEINKVGKLAELRDGLQAHLSTFASPKVFEVVTKLPSKVLLIEVPRLSTWPIQFQEAGVKEDNIALYFFAKDLESYERSYKNLLETMMKRDIALKGNFGGVELLIFSSNHLPQNAQRWNMLYFLWGVFRGRRVSPVQNTSGFAKGCLVSENDKAECDAKSSSADPNGLCLEGNVAKQDGRLDAERITAISAPEKIGITIPPEHKFNPKSILDVKTVQSSAQDAQTNPYNVEQRSSSSGGACPADNLVTLERAVKEEEEFVDTNSLRERKMTNGGPTKEHNEWQINHGKHVQEKPNPEAPNPSVSSSTTSMNRPRSFLPDGECASKKENIRHGGFESGDMDMYVEKVQNVRPPMEGATEEIKRGIPLDLNEAQSYPPDSPIPSPSPAVQPKRGDLFDLNVAQDYPPDKEEDGNCSAHLSLTLTHPHFP